MADGYLCLVLHTHLPYVRHPEYDYSLEEKWYYEAVTECYLPLIYHLTRLNEDKVDYRLTMSLSPTLISMMEDPLLTERYSRYLSGLQKLSAKEVERTKNDAAVAPITRMYLDYMNRASDLFHNRYQGRLLRGFQELKHSGKIEIITCTATHGYLPLLSVQQESIYAQIAVAVENYYDHFGETPRGIWLPECAYEPGLEEIISELGLQYFFTDTHGMLYAVPRPKYGVYNPILTDAGVAVFARDNESSKQVWSANEGYPGDYYYREFYRDIGYDLDYDYIKDYLHPRGMRGDTGLKYYRITGEVALGEKKPYEPEKARDKAAEHAGNFMFNREKQVEYLAGLMDRPPIIVAPYDAELFGHWWFEGPQWIDFLCRKIAFNQDKIKMITPSEYLNLGYPLQISQPSGSSWGNKGYHEVWLNKENDWLYRHLHHAAEKMIELATTNPQADGLLEKALTQAARELLLAQSSDWPFIMTAGTMNKYATRRAHDHLVRFLKLARDIHQNTIDPDWLEKISAADNIFPNLNYRVFHSMEMTIPVEERALLTSTSYK